MADHAVSNLFADGDTDPRLLPVIHPLHVHNQKLVWTARSLAAVLGGSLLYFLITVLVMMCGSFSPLFWVFLPALTAAASGWLYLYLAARTPRFGVPVLMNLVVLLLFLAAGELSGDMRETVERYMADLEKLNSNSVPKYLAESYFNLGNVEKGFAMLEKFVDYTPSNPGTWDASFRLVMQYNDNSDAFLQGTARLREKLEGWNRDNLGTISLSSDVSDYLDSMLGQSAAS